MTHKLVEAIPLIDILNKLHVIPDELKYTFQLKAWTQYQLISYNNDSKYRRFSI